MNPSIEERLASLQATIKQAEVEIERLNRIKAALAKIKQREDYTVPARIATFDTLYDMVRKTFDQVIESGEPLDEAAEAAVMKEHWDKLMVSLLGPHVFAAIDIATSE